MAERSPLLGRVEKAVSPAAATMFAERGRDRHFIFPLTATAVALYLIGKYIDGFVEGLGIKALGKQHGKTIKKAIECGREAFTGPKEPTREELEKCANDLEVTLVALHEHRLNSNALAGGSSRVLLALEERDIPRVECDAIEKEIVRAIWHS